MTKILDKYTANILGLYSFQSGSGADMSGNDRIMSSVNSTGSWRMSERGRAFSTEDKADYLATTSSPFDTAKTVGVWIKPNYDTSASDNRIVSNGDGTKKWTLQLQVAAGVFYPVISKSNTGAGNAATGADGITKDRWSFLSADIDDLELYLNGIASGVAVGASTISVTGNASVGARGDGAFGFPGEVGKVVILDTPLTPAEHAQWYTEETQSAHYDRVDIQKLDNTYDAFDPTGADILDVYIADGKGWNESLANETTGFLSNTGWDIVSGTWLAQWSGDSFKKELACVSSGRTSRQCTQAYGTWEFDIYHAATTNTRVYFIASTTDAFTGTNDGYMFSVLSTRRLTLHKITGGAASTLFATGASYVADDAYTKYRITRTPAGEFTGYYSPDGGITWNIVTIGGAGSGGSNPVTNNDFTDSVYCVFDIDTNDIAKDFIFKPYIE